MEVAIAEVDRTQQSVCEREPVYISCNNDRTRVLKVFREAISKSLPTATIAVSTMQEAMRPQKQTVLVQDENQLLENGVRTLLEELVGAAVDAGEPVMQYGRSIGEGEDGHGLITRLLDIILYLCERGHAEGGMVFQLLEDLTEVSTIKDCKEVFGYIEGKQETLGKAELFGRGKLVMLRTCNQLLRRLSKANDVVFCGRILMFLAHFFPLSERSAVNIKGVCNFSNETKYEKDPPSDGLPIDFNFYKTFWSLQEHFCNPVTLMQHPTRWQTFSASLATVLSTFDAQPLGDDNESSSHLDEGDDVTFNIKYLTSSNLMSLELKDPGFRRHVLVQCLIIFDFLKTPGKTEKDGLRETLREEMKIHEEHVKRLLETTPPKGKEFLASIEHILERERNWVWWKRDGCPAFERVIPERKTTQEASKRRKPRWRLGNKELHQLWRWADNNPNAVTDVQRVRMPPISEYWKLLADDMDPSAGIEDEYHHKNNKVYCWKGLRFSARQDLDGFSRYTEQKIGGVVPPELFTSEVRNLIHKNSDKPRAKGVKKEEDDIVSIVQTEDQADEAQANISLAGLDESGPPQDMDDGIPLDTDAGITADQNELNVPDRAQPAKGLSPPSTADNSPIHTSGSAPSVPPRPLGLTEVVMLDVSTGSKESSPKKSETKQSGRKRSHPDN